MTESTVRSDDHRPDLDDVEIAATELLRRLAATESAAREHLAAAEEAALRRCQLLIAQAELDAELIRLHARRESHALLTRAGLGTTAHPGVGQDPDRGLERVRSEEHTSELQSH